MTTRPRRLLRALAGVGALALVPLVVGACGGGDPVTPRTTTITVSPPAPGGSSTSATPSTTTTAAVTPPKNYEQAMQHFAAGKVDAGAKAQFTSPTGNIYCSISPSGDVAPGCEVRDGRIAPPAGTCDSGGGAKDIGRIEWQGDTPKPVCNSDTMIKPGATVLQYGSIATVQGSPFRCISETIGMTCLNTAGKKGFFLAKGAYAVF